MASCVHCSASSVVVFRADHGVPRSEEFALSLCRDALGGRCDRRHNVAVMAVTKMCFLLPDAPARTRDALVDRGGQFHRNPSVMDAGPDRSLSTRTRNGRSRPGAVEFVQRRLYALSKSLGDSGYRRDRTPSYGYEATREAAMAAFAKS